MKQDMLPTLMAAVGVDDIKEQLLNGYTAGDTTYNVHIDGYNFLPYLTSLGGPDSEVVTPREEFFYLTDGGFPSALRFEDWKLVFSEMQGEGFDVWFDPYVNLRGPRIINLVKPISGRASLNIHFVNSVEELPQAVAEVQRVTNNTVLIEAYLPGREFCISVCGYIQQFALLCGTVLIPLNPP
ncbi:MAG: hypothetical protein F6K47_23785 [Symploca sp. SIO2E6]|nr:hypothetical protein [Symploca sp. SIO2E6]